ncbi:MAG: hypothetical protein KAH10_04070 [Flavobacteriales bacterium]|nr:hypothetical protein [Flavobacteriales bacterium]
MDTDYTTTIKKRGTFNSASGKLYSRIKKALTLEEIRNKYRSGNDNSKAIAS